MFTAEKKTFVSVFEIVLHECALIAPFVIAWDLYHLQITKDCPKGITYRRQVSLSLPTKAMKAGAALSFKPINYPSPGSDLLMGPYVQTT